MKLIKLSSSDPLFKTVSFNPVGLTLIVGDESNTKGRTGTSNGVGKTLILGLINFCLGGKLDDGLKKIPQDRSFSLIFEHAGREYVVERSIAPKSKIILNGNEFTYKDYLKELNQLGAFSLPSQQTSLTFRSLFRRFARYTKKDCDNAYQLDSDTDFSALLNIAYLIGLDHHLILSKKKNKEGLDGLKSQSSVLNKEELLRNYVEGYKSIPVRLNWVKEAINCIEIKLKNYDIGEEYDLIKQEADSLTCNLRDLEKKREILKYEITHINDLLTEKPDISKDTLLNLYKIMGNVFKEETLNHLNAVENFHETLLDSRNKRLRLDKQALVNKLQMIESQLKNVGAKRDSLFKFLNSKHSLDDYSALVKKKEDLQHESEMLLKYLNMKKDFALKKKELQEKMRKEDLLAENSLREQDFSDFSRMFIEYARILFPNLPSGIVIENDTKENKIRFNITVEIQGSQSDGIGSAVVLAFDWLILTKGLNHAIDFLFHDNRLFADLDPRARANWLEYVYIHSHLTGKQYIATLNRENLKTSLECFSSEIREKIKQSVILTLAGNQPESKLLGVQFG